MGIQDVNKTGAVTDQPVDIERIEAAVAEILEALGEDPQRDGLLRTPARVAKMLSLIHI